ncbi:2Fe-2S iron-sulfur cluster-binding protein [Rhodococcus sp. IEGM1428]|uniref:2Fe-2S iron-sulfur cluster-binding protein n=1 Tax=Rhodococcus sp. IEGM1428 TaxID=3392191 RepID=UPI003D0E2E5C
MQEQIVHTLRVAEVIRETDESCSIVFDASPNFDYVPGQFLTLRVPTADGASVARCYSLASSPHLDESPKVTVKRVAGGHASNWICDNVMPGSVLESLPPAGVFTPPSLDANLLLVAAGSGITPVMSIAKSALEVGSGRVVLLYANQHEQSVIFADELRALVDADPDRFVVVHWLVSVQGKPTMTQLRGLASPYADFDDALLCGPEPFRNAMSEALADLGFPRDHVHAERFLSLQGDPFSVPVPRVQADDSGVSASITVDLDGVVTSHSWPRSQKLLDVLLAAGIEAPYSCREGACSACACRVVDGEVKMLRNEVLEAEDLEDGLVLSCQALPVSDTIRISYS